MLDEKFENGYALIIGTASDPKIEATGIDAELIGNAIEHHSFYPKNQIRTLIAKQATKQNILGGFEWLIQAAKENPEITVFIYYAGHGYPPSKKENFCNQYHLFPNGADLKAEDSLITASELGALFNQIQAQKLVWFLNACHSGGFSDGLSFALGENESERNEKSLIQLQSEISRETNSFINSLSSGVGRVIISAAQADAKSYIPKYSEREKVTTIFGQALLEALQGNAHINDELIALSTIYDYLSRNVSMRAASLNQEQITSLKGDLREFPVVVNRKYIPSDRNRKLLRIEVSNFQMDILEEALNKSSVEKTYGFRIGATQIEEDWDHSTFLEICKNELRNNGQDTSHELKSALKELTGVYLFRLLNQSDQDELYRAIQSKLNFRFILDFTRLPKLYKDTIVALPWEQMRIPSKHFKDEFPISNLRLKKYGIFSRKLDKSNFSEHQNAQKQIKKLRILFIDNSASQELSKSLSKSFQHRFDDGKLELANNIQISILDLSQLNRFSMITLKESMQNQPHIIHYFGPIGCENEKIFLPLTSNNNIVDQLSFSSKKMDESHPFRWIRNEFESIPTIVTLHADSRSTNQFPDKFELAIARLSSYGVPHSIFLPPLKNTRVIDLIKNLYPLDRVIEKGKSFLLDFSEFYSNVDTHYQYALNEFEPIFYCVPSTIVEFIIHSEHTESTQNLPPTKPPSSKAQQQIKKKIEDEFGVGNKNIQHQSPIKNHRTN